jgi:hypothetical protein
MKTGRKFKFHGAFGLRRRAVSKARRVKHSFIRRVKIKRETRYMVLTRR